MEDSLICFDEVNERFGLDQNKELVSVWGVFDGHGGKQVALHLEARLIRVFVDTFNGDNSNDFGSVIRETYKRMDQEILEVSTNKGWICGSTGAICFLKGKQLYCSNVGDSEILVGKKIDGRYAFECPSGEHTAQAEEARILENGGIVRKGRIGGNVMVSRAFGDINYKYPYNKGKGDFVSAVPEVNSMELDGTVKFVVVSSDGLWEKVAKQKVLDVTVAAFKAKKSSFEVAETLMKLALDSNATDNTTIIVIRVGEV